MVYEWTYTVRSCALLKGAQELRHHTDDLLKLSDWLVANIVNAMAGASRLHGSGEEMAPECAEKARTIMWFMYADIGPVTIARS